MPQHSENSQMKMLKPTNLMRRATRKCGMMCCKLQGFVLSIQKLIHQHRCDNKTFLLCSCCISNPQSRGAARTTNVEPPPLAEERDIQRVQSLLSSRYIHTSLISSYRKQIQSRCRFIWRHNKAPSELQSVSSHRGLSHIHSTTHLRRSSFLCVHWCFSARRES